MDETTKQIHPDAETFFLYCCPIKIYLSHKNKADFICEVSLFLLDFCRQTKLI